MKPLLPLLLLALAPTRATEGEHLITDHGAKGDNAFDNAPVINGLINGFGPEGGTIVIPAGDFRLQSPVIVKSNVAIRDLAICGSDSKTRSFPGRPAGSIGSGS